MQERYLGGEHGRRGFFGAKHTRARVVGMSAVVLVGAFAVVALQLRGVIGTAVAAVVVWVGTIRTHRGSVFTRVADRRRWRERTRRGTVAFAPVAQRPTWVEPASMPARVGLPTAGRARRAQAAREWARWRDWPDGVEGMHWLQRGPGQPGILWHTPTGEDGYLSVVFGVEGQVRGIESDQFVGGCAEAFGRMLARYGSKSSLVRRVQPLTRVMPMDTAPHEAWIVERLDPTAPEEFVDSYDAVLRLTAASGPVERHFVTVRWPLTSEFMTAASRRGPYQQGWVELMAAEIASVRSHLIEARMGEVRPLSAAQVAAVLRHMQCPTWPLDQIGDVDIDNPWFACEDEWSAAVTSGLGPNGTHEEWWHRTALIPIDGVETGPRTPLWVRQLLSGWRSPVIRTFAVQIEVVPAVDARWAARSDLTSDLADIEAQAAKGMLVDEERKVTLTAARQRQADLAPGSGHHGIGWCGHLSVSARSRDELVQDIAHITEAAGNAGIADLDWLDTLQGPAMACTWPVARGMRPVGTTPASRVRGVLAGSGRKEALS